MSSDGDGVLSHNRDTWDHQVRAGNRWTRPVTAEAISAAREGRWELLLTPQKPVPRQWYPPLAGTRVLALASGGGQQGPILAAAGARVVVFDASAAQLRQDRSVAEREGLELETVQGDMADLRAFAEASFDLVFHPVANCFVPHLEPVWRETFRVLAPGGVLLAGFANPVLYLFDDDPETGMQQLEVRHSIPYSDADRLSAEQRQRWRQQGHALEFGHSLEAQIGGQLAAGFVLTGFYEDRLDVEQCPLSRYIANFIATRAIKPGGPRRSGSHPSGRGAGGGPERP